MAKRILDLLASSIGLVLLAPVLITVAVLVRLKLGRPILYSQVRIGKDGAPFQVRKFRTMRDARDSKGRPLSDEARLSSFGRQLRSLSLDELPQLWNVLTGEMSLVGPRPLLPEYMARYTKRQARRHEVRPGITGWAQVNGRNSLAWEEKFELDVWYVDNQKLWLDLKILVLTVWRVCGRSGVSAEGTPTMPEFLGAGVKNVVE